MSCHDVYWIYHIHEVRLALDSALDFRATLTNYTSVHSASLQLVLP